MKRIIIELEEPFYENIIHHVITQREIDELCSRVAHGTPLPKRHGRLIDADMLLSIISHDKREAFTKHQVWLLASVYNEKVPTIIEADGSDKT